MVQERSRDENNLPRPASQPLQDRDAGAEGMDQAKYMATVSLSAHDVIFAFL